MTIQKRNALIALFLNYAFTDVYYEYSGLTERERAFCTEEEFVALADWVNTQLPAKLKWHD
jgi:hypothetical protein